MGRIHGLARWCAVAAMLVVSGVCVRTAPAQESHPVSSQQIEQWRTEMRRALFIPDPLPALQVQNYGSITRTEGVTLEHVSYVTSYGLRVPADVFRPTKRPK